MGFLIVPNPKIDESINSFIIRLTIENDYEKTKWIFESLHLVNSNHLINHIYNCNSDHPSLERLANMTSLGTKRINGMTFLPLLGNYNNTDCFIDTTLRVNLHKLHIKICPLCLVENLYYKKVWDLHQYTSCHIHKCLLVDKCDICHRKIYIQTRNNISRCLCGRDFRSLKPRYLKEIGIERFIYEKIYDVQNTSNNFLYTLNFRVALYIITNLSSKFLYRTVKRTISFEQRNDTMHNIFNAFEQFPDSFYRFLDNYYIRVGNQNEGLLRGFRNVYNDMMEKFSVNEDLYFLYETFVNYINYHWGGDIMRIRGLQHEFIKKQWVTKHESADYLNKTVETINKLIESGELSSKTIMKEKKHTFVNIKSLANYKFKMEKMGLEKKELKKYTLTHSQLIALEKIGVLKKGDERNGFHKFESSSIINFFSYLNRITIKNLGTKNEYIDFKTVVRKYCQFRNGLTGFFQDVMNGELPIYVKCKKVTSLSSLYFIESDVDKLANNKPFKTKGDIAKEVGISVDKLTYLIDNSFLKYKIIDNHVVVQEDDILEFKKSFIFFQEIKELFKKLESNISNLKVHNYIFLLKIMPLNIKKKPNDPLVYDRQECTDKIIEFFNG
jgi:TniQ